MISNTSLYRAGALEVNYRKDELIFSEGENANFYFQIIVGSVKMFNLTEDGKEFVQGIFEKGRSFGEPPLFGDFVYPASAVATISTRVFKLPKIKLMQLLELEPKTHLEFTKALSNRLNYKAMIMKEVSVYPPEHRIFALLSYLKRKDGTTEEYAVELTRQQISELTGLRVETVIRAIKKLAVDKKLSIRDRKIFM